MSIALAWNLYEQINVQIAFVYIFFTSGSLTTFVFEEKWQSIWLETSPIHIIKMIVLLTHGNNHYFINKQICGVSDVSRMKGCRSKTMPRVDLEQGCGRNGGTGKSDLLARDNPAMSREVLKMRIGTFQINSGWVLTNPIALQIGWIRERRPE